MYDAGAAVGVAASDGIADVLVANLSRITDAANRIVSEVERALTAGLRIQSPSKITRYISEMVGMGLAGGMMSTLPQISGAAVP